MISSGTAFDKNCFADLNLLFLANRVPYPPYRGDKLKIYNLARRLATRHRLVLLCFTEDGAEEQYRAELEAIFAEVHFVHQPKWRSVLNGIRGLWQQEPFQVLYFHAPEMQRATNQLLRSQHFDAVHIQHLRMAPYMASCRSVPRILDLPDAFSLYWKRRQEVKGNPVRRWLERIEQQRVYRYEKQMLGQFNLSLVCSPEDLKYLCTEHGLTNLRLLPNGVDLDTFTTAEHDYSLAQDVLFTGNMDYAPNVDAVVYFKETIFPIIKKQVPSARFIIAGQRPVPAVLALQDADTVVTGFVKDMAAMYQTASVVVAPLRFGAGTQNKVLEAMAMGVPVVCSNIGFNGLGIASGEGAYMELDASDFANRVIELLQSAPMRQQVGTLGSATIRKRFDWNVVTRQLEQYFEEIAGIPV